MTENLDKNSTKRMKSWKSLSPRARWALYFMLLLINLNLVLTSNALQNPALIIFGSVFFVLDMIMVECLVAPDMGFLLLAAYSFCLITMGTLLFWAAGSPFLPFITPAISVGLVTGGRLHVILVLAADRNYNLFHPSEQDE